MSPECTYPQQKPFSEYEPPLSNPPQSIATLGPASIHHKVIREMIQAGTAIFRINTSHPGLWAEWIALVKQIAKEEKRTVQVMVDLPGPKYRIGNVHPQYGELRVDDRLRFTTKGDAGGRNGLFALPHPDIFDALEPDMTVKLSDGRIELKVLTVTANVLTAIVTRGGTLRPKAGVNVPEADLKSSPITDDDKKNIKATIKAQPDYYCLSFTSHGDDIRELRDIIYEQIDEDSAYHPLICAKVETAQGLRNLQSIVQAADMVMSARGDMECEIEPAQVPLQTRRLVKMCRHYNTPAIVATGILETMEKNAYASRAERDSIYHLVKDGFRYLMVSNETAIGDHPLLVIQTLHEQIKYAWEDQLSNDLMGWR